MKVNQETSKFTSGDIPIDIRKIALWCIHRDTSINVEVVEYRCLQLR